MIGVEKKLPGDGIGPVLIRLFDEQDIAKGMRVAEISQLVLGPGAAFQFAGVGQEHTGLPQ